MSITRLWVKGALRRPGRGLLVVAGLLAMTVATVAALVAADSLEEVFLADARAHWGAVDVAVLPAGGRVMHESLARTVGAADGGMAAAWAPRLVLDTVVLAEEEREPLARVLGLGPEEESFAEPLRGRGTVDLQELGPDEVVVNARLARRLDMRIGQTVTLNIAVPEVVERDAEGRETGRRPAHAASWPATVAGIADDGAVADLGRTANVLARRDGLQRVTGLDGYVTALHAAAPAAGREAAEELVDAYELLIRQLGLVGVPVKEDMLDIARDEGSQFRGIFLTMAFLVVAASVVVTANLVMLLGQDRAREVALLRAIGARRRTVARLLSAEGGLYALLSALAGAALAVPLGHLMADAVAGHFGSIELARGREMVDLSLRAGPEAIVTGVLIVLVVALLAVHAGSRRVARLDIGSVLRGAPVILPAPASGSRRPLAAWSAGMLLIGMGVTAAGARGLLVFLGLSLALLAGWLHVRRGPGARGLDTWAAAVGLVWFIAAPALFGDFPPGDVQAGFGILALAGAGAIGCAAVLTTAHLRALVRFVRGYLPRGRIQAVLRTAAAYGEQQRSRSGAIAGVAGVVLFMVAAMVVLGSASDIPVQRQRGGYDVIGTAVAPLDTERILATPGLAHAELLAHSVVPEGAYWVEDADGEERSVPYPVRAVRADHQLAGRAGWDLADTLPEYASAREALAAVMSEPDGVVVDRYSRPEGTRPGDSVLITTGRVTHEFTLLAVLDTFALNAVILGTDRYDEAFASRGPTMLLAVGEAEPAQVAADLEAAGHDQGLVVVTMAEAAEEVLRINRTFTDVFALLLLLGLLVMLVAVGALEARAMRERRAHLGVLRACGFRRRDVARALVAEHMLAGVVGVLLGLGLGLGVLWLLFRFAFADLAFVVDLTRLGLALALTLAVLVVAAVAPAVSTRRRDPAEALRDLG